MTGTIRQWLRNDRGHLIRELTDEKVLAVLTENYQTPHEVSDKLKCSISGAQQTLKRMHKEKLIDGGLFGNRWLYRKVGALT